METFVYQGRKIEYEVRGEGVPFVFLHGMGGSMQQIFQTYDPISGVKLITMNQQGHGNSPADWENYDFGHLADDVLALLEHLGEKQVVLGGISMGAAVSLNLAVHYPERVKKLLLIRNAWTDRPMSEPVCQAYHDLGLALKAKNQELFYQSRGWEIVREPSAYTRNAFLNCFEEPACYEYWQKYLILPQKTPISSNEELKQLTMPVMIVACKNDLCHPFVYGVNLHEQIPDSSFVEIPDKDLDAAEHRTQINKIIQKLFSK